MDWLCNIFGYLLNYIYTFVKNYGLALIIFSLITKIIMIPLSIKQNVTPEENVRIVNTMQERSGNSKAIYKYNQKYRQRNDGRSLCKTVVTFT